MLMPTGRFVLPNWKTGLITFLVQVLQCILAYYMKAVWVMAMPLATAVGFVIFSDVLSFEDRAEKEDRSFLSRYTIIGGIGTAGIAAIQLITLTGVVSADDNPMTVFYNSLILSVVFFAIAVVGKRLKPPKTFSDLTGWFMLVFVVVQALVAYIRKNTVIFIPNEMMFVTYACWICGALMFFTTGKRKSTLIGSLAPHFAFVVGGGAIFEAATREMPLFHQYTWAIVVGAATVMFVYGAIDYFVFRPRRNQVTIEHRKLD